MSYIGNTPNTNFADIPSVSRYNGDGSTTTFTLTQSIGNVQDILVSVDGVVQDSSSYSLSGDTSLVFSEAPSSGTSNIFVNYLGLMEQTVTPPAANKGTFKGDGIFRTNVQSLNTSTTVLATENANVTGPFTVASGVTLTIESGGTLVTV